MKSVSAAILVFAGLLSASVVYAAMIMAPGEHEFGLCFIAFGFLVGAAGLVHLNRAWKVPNREGETGQGGETVS